MRFYLLASTAALALAVPATAQTITTKVTSPVQTSTIKNGTPDSITITAAGSVVPTAGTAVTQNSNHTVTNQGAVTIANANDAIGILATAGTSGEILNSGTISLEEPYTATDTDNDGDLDGPFALGVNRQGIRTAGPHIGRVVNSGTIRVEGNDSSGIWLGGAQTGALVHDGTTNVLGDRTMGVRAAAIDGNVRLAGSVSASGRDAVAARFTGDVTGAIVVQGSIGATGYRYPTAPTATSKLDADDLLQGGPALMIEGKVSGGVIFSIPPKDNSATVADEDGDGIEDAKEGSAKVASYGAAPAVVIGATDRAIAIGPVAGVATGFGLVIDGAIAGLGVYSGVDANGLVIGGRGGAVTIAGGMSVAGSVAATSNGASATALRIGSGASVPEVRIAGLVESKGGNAATAHSTALAIDQGAAVSTIRNSGTIKATTAGENGHATAIIDRSGAVMLVENSGGIGAAGAKAGSGRNIAIDLFVNGAGATIRQTQVGAGFAAPAIVGDIRLGTGNDKVEIADGLLSGAVQFGAGDDLLALSGDAVHGGSANFGTGDDRLTLEGSAVFAGQADFGGGADALTLAGTARFSGSIASGANLAVNVSGGVLDVNKPAAIGSLNVGSGGTIIVTLDKTAGSGTAFDIDGAAAFGSGAKMVLRIADLANAEGRYTILEAGTLTGAAGITTSTELIPFVFKASLASNAGPNQLAVDVSRRSAAEMGLNRSQTSAHSAVFAAMGKDDQMEGVFLGITDGEQFRDAVRKMMPDHAGGAFEAVSLGTRTFARQVADPVGPVYLLGGVDVILTSGLWTTEKDEGATAAYDLGGLGFSAAGEVDTGLGSFGASVTWFWNEYDTTTSSRTLSDTYELAGYWRAVWGGLQAHARGSVGLVDFRARRTFTGVADDKAVEKSAIGEWGGTVVSASGGLSYEGGGRHLFFRPSVTFDYLRLEEDGYTDTGGGEGLDLIVEDRKSDEMAVNGGLALGVDFSGNGAGETNWFRIEGEGGWREIVGGALGATTARFEDGTPFTLDPEQVDSGWFVRARAMGGTGMFAVSGEAGAEDRHGATALTLRGTLRMGF